MPVVDMSRLIIEKNTAGNFGLAPKRWLAQLEAIRLLPELAPPKRRIEIARPAGRASRLARLRR